MHLICGFILCVSLINNSFESRFIYLERSKDFQIKIIDIIANK